jgi:transposase-like protein
MTKRTRRNHSPDFKAKVAFAAMKDDRTITQMSDQYGVHVSQITAWKDQLQAGASNVFGPGVGSTPATPPVETQVDAANRKLCEFVEGANLDGEPHGPHSHAATAWAVKGRVP